MMDTENPASADSYTHGGNVPAVLEQSIGENFRSVAARFPEYPAVIEVATGRSWTYAQMDRATDQLARALISAGIGIGDRLGIWSPNCAEWTLLQYATAKAGIILVNVNPAYRLEELSFVVGQCGMRALAVAPSDQSSDYTAMARTVAAQDNPLQDLIHLPRPDGLDPTGWDASADVAQNPGREFTWESLLELADQTPQASLEATLKSLDPHDAINLQYTSGTTGFPKGATLSHHNILNNGFHIAELLGYTENDRVVLPVPFFHCFGMVIGNLGALSHGAATVLPGRAFKPEETLHAVQAHGGTSLYGVPTMFIAELALPDFADYDLTTLRTGVMAGSTCPEEVMERVISEMNMTEVAICYGMTETSPVSTMTRTDDSLERRTQTVGRTMPQLESKVVDPVSGKVVPRGSTGELCTRGYAVMKGYWGEPEKTAAAIDADGWMHTGDLASMDQDGYLRVEGRIKDLIIRGGENVSPREIEEFLYRHPDVQDVQVIGVPDEKYGEEIMACIILHEGAPEMTLETVREYCGGRIAHYKIPRYVQIRSSFPMTISGKIRKVEMRQEAIRMVAGN
ncbi:AMP-binding protein [Arthrobacter rhombi]|uniref:Acetoacetyl-CoA synthetase / Long-chain-fatty-acid--CoA ligase n=2 Tax=Micrococcaceae TaxID=1268 RepID=A0A1R4GES7_9MICC|nr:Acetoacetyl-CoA synthetase / Long-chain-fatty-acid--CoA ligase [Arthrobacter rhombi]